MFYFYREAAAKHNYFLQPFLDMGFYREKYTHSSEWSTDSFSNMAVRCFYCGKHAHFSEWSTDSFFNMAVRRFYREKYTHSSESDRRF